MPLVRIDAIAGRSEAEIQTLLDAAHRATLTVFGVPMRGRYEIYQEHRRVHMMIADHEFDASLSDNGVIVTLTSGRLSRKAKQAFYVELCRELFVSCGISAADVMVSVTHSS
jgi:hypothetical protein